VESLTEIIQYWPFVPPSRLDALWCLATEKWAEIEANSPDLSSAVLLQKRLIRLVLEASAMLDEAASLNLAPQLIAQKCRRGLPVLRDETVPIPGHLADILPPLCDAMADGGAGDSAKHIGDAIVARSIDAISLLRVSLARDPDAIRTSALHMGLSPDLVWLIGELGSSPLAHHLQQSVWRSESFGSTDVRPQDWNHGYCPFCGSWPVFIESIDVTRTLRCSYCALGWSLQSHRCIYCSSTGEGFVAAAIDVNRPQQRVELCTACSNYTKVIDKTEPTPFPLLAIDDLATMHLDRGAMDRGYRRPPLINLDAIEPRKSIC
jgi:FdhE protein